MNRTLRHGTSFQKIGALCAGVTHVRAASLATGLVPHRALAAPGARDHKRTRILWTLILAVLLPAASSLGQTPPGDSYLCYKAALAPGQATFTPVQKTLQDQFGTRVVDVKRVLAVCNPTQTAVHQVGYQIAPATTPPQPVFVKTDRTASDQFGTHPLTVVRPVELRAPSAKVLGAGGTGLVDATGIDHFECYKAVPARNAPKFVAPPPVAITDEFGTVTLTLKKITKLCTPVNKNGEDPTAPQHAGHLVCYQAKLPKGTRFAPQTVSVNNTNFGPAVLRATAVAELCVPAFIPCSTPQWPTCGGTCPVGNVCLPGIDFCACVPSDNTCGLSGAPTCGGTCPNGDVCTWINRHTDLDMCSCEPPDQTCGFFEAPTCGGTCPSGTVCGQLSGGNVCGCDAPDSCSFSEAPTCGGTCPLGICAPYGNGCGCYAGCFFCGGW